MPWGVRQGAPGPRAPALGPTNFVQCFLLLLLPFLSSFPTLPLSCALVFLGWGSPAGLGGAVGAMCGGRGGQHTRSRLDLCGGGGSGRSLGPLLPHGRDYSLWCGRRMQGGYAIGVGLLAFLPVSSPGWGGWR